MADELIDLRVEEVSGVDHPANLVEGWLVMKAKVGDDPANFAYVPDPDSPSTWKLDISDAVHVGAAAAALSPGGFRGQRVQIPAADLPGVKAKIRSAWRKFNPDKGDDDMPTSIRKEAELEEELAALFAEIVSFDKNISHLKAALEAGKEYLMDAPDDVKAAANTLYAYVAQEAEAMGGMGGDENGDEQAPTPPPPGPMATNKSFVVRAAKRLLEKLTKAKDDNEEEDTVTPEQMEELAARTAEAVAKAIEPLLTPAEAEAPAEETPAVEDAPAETPAAEPEAEVLIKAEDVEALRAELAAEREAHDTTRTALEQTLDRVEAIEKRLIKSRQPAGQERQGESEEIDPKSDAAIFKGLSRM